MDYRTMFDRDYVEAWDLEGRDATVTISKVEAKTLTGQGNRKTRKPIIWFHGRKKGLALNKTNGKTIARLYGTDTAQWIDKSITLYPTQTEMNGEPVDCIRIRPQAPPPPQSRRSESLAVTEPPVTELLKDDDAPVEEAAPKEGNEPC